MAPGSRVLISAEILILVGAGTVAIVFSGEEGLGPPGIKQWLVPSFFLYAPIIASLVSDKDFSAIGLSRPEWRKAGADLLIFSFIILPIFLVSWWALARYGQGMSFRFRSPEGLAGLILWQLLGVALPEEVFFRGWLQGRINQLLSKSWRIPGAMIGPGLFIAAALFAGGHFLAKPQPIRLLVFFPGLLFGYFRERQGSVWGPILAHAAGNISFLALQSWAVH